MFKPSLKNFSKTQALTILLVFSGAALLASCQSVPTSPHGKTGMRDKNHGHPHAETWEPDKPDSYKVPAALHLAAMPDFDDVIKSLLRKRFIFIGESHDRISHHLNQLEIIKRIHAVDPNIAIGLEFFQQPFQAHMDEYINGTIDEREFLNKTEYFSRWRIDYRHYRPIIQYAKEHSIPLLALDMLEEIQRKVGLKGVDSLTEDEKKHLPDKIDRSNEKYREFLESIYKRHPAPATDNKTFDNFIDVQLVRDETMAQNAVNYYNKHPEKRMIILAGGGHLIYGYGIPQRVTRRLPNIESAIVLNGLLNNKPSPDLADFVLLPEPLKLPKAGRLGVIMDKAESGSITVSGFSNDSPAKLAGVQNEDHFSKVDGINIESMADVKFALLEKRPGDKVILTMKRKGWIGSDKTIDVEVTLY